MKIRIISFLLLILSLFFTQLVHADVMNLNNFMPTQLEDATPIEEKTFDVQLSASLEKNSDDVMIYRPNFRYGMTKSLQLEAQGTIYSGGDESQSGETEFGFLYRLNESQNYLPEIGLQPMVMFPTGKQAEGIDYSLKLDLTTTLKGSSERPITQIHGNLQIAHNNQHKSGETVDRWLYAFGVSHRLFVNTAVVIDGIIEDEFEKGEKSYLSELGLHQHLGQNYFVGIGLALGYGASAIKQQGLLSLEKQI